MSWARGAPAARHRSRHVAQALQALHLREGDAVATLAWSTHRHLELNYGVSGMGAVLHTVNPRCTPPTSCTRPRARCRRRSSGSAT